MYHSRWRGSHKESGYKYGDILYSHGKNIDLHKLVNDEKLSYANNVYEI
ncbi:hypothetical protein [Criibacterium bergeronii]|nr:hypothetical protein [Criibacterium bergeronii]MBS6063501.1 hypothetical protein [Peptostreptococcaceae bacterium]